MKLMKLVPVFVLLVLSVTVVMAIHVPQASLQPNTLSANAENDVSLNIANSMGDSIVMVELVVPESGQVPLYKITEISRPEGWTYDITTRTTEAFPYKVTWHTTGSGIEAGESLGFGLKVLSPSQMGEDVWSWKTTDTNSGEQEGTLKTKTGMAPAAYLKVFAPSKIKAGNSISLSVTAYNSLDEVKTDYTGTIVLSSSDPLAIMPESYTFSEADNGHRSFIVKLKTAGTQTITVSDASGKMAAVSTTINVGLGSLTSLEIIADDLDVNVGETVIFNAIARDLYNNMADVTAKTIWDIENQASGSWVGNTYTAGKRGLWTVTARYLTLIDGISLNVGREVVTVEIPLEIPVEEEIVPEEAVPEVPETQMAELSISGEDSIVIPAGANDTMILTVNNEGNVDLTGVEINFEGVPSDWVLSFPLSSDIDAGNSKDYLVIIYVPENETGTKEITFTANSNEGATAEKAVTLRLEAPPTGLFEAIPSNILQLGVVIIAVAAVVIIGYELWFKK